jgi:osmotically inducible lipoprotein OsmB
MARRKLFVVSIIPLFALSACAANYAAEGAGVGAAGGAAAAILTGEDVVKGAAIGAAAGAAVGYFIDKDKNCGGYDDRGRLDDDCYGEDGYPESRPQ